MTFIESSARTTRMLGLLLLPACLIACGSSASDDDQDGTGASGGNLSGSGGSGASSGSTGGAPASGGTAGAAGVSGSSGGGAVAGTSGSAAGGNGGGGAGTGGASTGGAGGGASGSAGTGGDATGGTGGVTGGGPRTMGFIGCSMAENTAQGYQAVGGERMWPAYGTGGDVVQNWTNTNSAAWQKFDNQVAMYGEPTAVWVQICIFSFNGATYDEVKQLIANARSHAAPGATIYITGQPLYNDGWTCNLAGEGGPELTDDLAQQAAADATQDVVYAGSFGPLGQGTTSDSCHANSAGQQLLGDQAVEKFGE